MFRKSRLKIVVLVMSLLLAVLAGTLILIYVTTYSQISQENRDMLEMYAELYVRNGMPNGAEDEETALPEDEALPEDGARAGEEDEPLDTDNQRFLVSTFYSVTFLADGSVLEINIDSVPQYSEEEVITLALTLLEGGAVFGTYEDIVFLVTEETDFTLVTMMDNTILGETIESLLYRMLAFGGIAIVVLFVLSFVISRWIIQPLEVSDRKQRQFISDAGHELKTPISTIAANAELLSREVGENRWLANIRYENGRMSLLVQQLLELARAESGTMPQEPADFSRIVLAGVLPFEGMAFEQGLALSYEIAPDITLTGNAGQLGELVSVLVDNALQHTVPQGVVRITLSAAHGNAVLSVANQGPEIPEEEREKIFDRFYRSDAARTGESGHYGLGLAIARAVVQAHRGKISVACRNGMTEFLVTLPLRA